MGPERNSRDEIRRRWSADEYMLFINCLKQTGRYTFTEEDFARASSLMYARFGVERTAKQLELKYKELRRSHQNPEMCEFFIRIRECEVETKLNASYIGACENGISPILQELVKTEMPEKDGSSQNNRSSDAGLSHHFLLSPSPSDSSHDMPSPSLLQPTHGEREEEAKNERVEECKEEKVEEWKQEKEAGKKNEAEEGGGGKEKAEKRKIVDDDDDIQVIDETPPRFKQKRRNSQMKQESPDTSGVGSCPKCKVSVNGSDHFCNACGCPLPIRCFDCDCEVQFTSRFCSNCGARQRK